MQFDIVTIFPRMVEAGLAEGILARALQRELLRVRVRDLRDFTDDRHRTVDDLPYGGGPGMVIKPEPLFRAVEAIRRDSGEPHAIVLVSPQGRAFTQAEAARISRLDRVTILCGRYEGIDDRVREGLVTEELSIGDYVLSGGELPALVIVDAVARLIPGVVGDEDSVAGDSFSRGLLDYPHFTRPAEFREWKVPDVLVSGHHGEIRKWRKRRALELTLDRRPELLIDAELDVEEQEILRELMERKKEPPMGVIDVIEKSQMTERPQMQAGDTVKVHVKVREGDKERIQVFEGILIGMHRGGARASFTVRKVSFGQGVERIFPLHSPIIQKVEVVRSAKVRRAKLYYLRDLKGKAARMRDTSK